MDRDRFLATVRQSLERGGEMPVPEPEPHPDPAPSAVEERRDRLIRELRAVGGKVYRAGSTAAARRKILRILKRRGARRVVRGNTARLRSLDLDGALEEAGCEVTACDLRDAPRCADRRERLRDAAFAADAGITWVDGAVAETGTLALLARPGQGRSVSLLPPVHVAVLDAADVVWELGELFERTAEGGPPSALTLVTGPSRTGDIELVLTVGVHGPGELHLVVIDAASGSR